MTFNGAKIELVYNENLNFNSLPSLADYLVQVNNGQAITIESVGIQKNTLTLTLQTILAAKDIVLVSYIPGTNPVLDLFGNQTAGFNERKAEYTAITDENTVSSNIETVKQTKELDRTSPVLVGAALNASNIILYYDEQLKPESIPAIGDFRLTLHDSLQASVIQSVYIKGSKEILSLNRPVAAGDMLKISYTPGVSPVKDLAGNKAAGFQDLLIDNTQAQVNDPHFSEQWWLLSNQYEHPVEEEVEEQNTIVTSIGIDAVDAWQQSEGEDVIVAVLDTGIDISHEDLKNNIWTNIAEIPGNNIDDDGNGYIDDLNGWNFADDTCSVHNPDRDYDEWHGTHIAGIIAAEKGNEKGIAGVSPKAKIMPLQVFNSGVAYTSDIIDAIGYAKQMGAKVVNCSWGTTSENPALKEAMEESGLVFICAAGNSYKHIDESPVYPAAFTLENIISVASINKTGNLSLFFNYGQNSVDVTAPGENILSATPGDSYGESGGTSQAAAFVSGEAALVLSKYPNLSLSDLKNRIRASSDRLSSVTGKVYGSDKINCTSALAEPIIINDNVIQIPDGQGQEQGTGTSDNGDYSLFSIDEWNAGGNLLTAREFFGTAVLNDKIYSIGGQKLNSQNLVGVIDSVEIYDPISGSSTLASSINTDRSGLGTAATNGKIYAIGGFDGSYHVNNVEEYNPATNTWSNKAGMSNRRTGLGVAAVNGKIYAIGGYKDRRQVNYVEEYDPATNTWSSKASMPTARSNFGVAVVNGKIYAIGGSKAVVL
ncbi:Major intracellular serine protease precursor [Pelotomaculum sp. FP]|nr:Major intracellular serine protease precursor [Pelotomaculum sp. FP]